MNMTEIELIPKRLTDQDNTINVEMTDDEIWFMKHFIKEYNPQKIVEIGVSAGGNTVNLLHWKDKDAKLFSIDISTKWYRDNSKLSGFMAEEVSMNDNWKLYRGCDYLDVYEEIGDDIDFIIIDTVHAMPGEFFSFIAALPHLKDGCVVILHDIHLNLVGFSDNNFGIHNIVAYCTGLLFGGVSSNEKWVLKSTMPNIGAFIIDDSTRDNIKDIFHILGTSWSYYPFDPNNPFKLNLDDYSTYIKENYSGDCYDLYENCLKLQSKYLDFESSKWNKLKRFISGFL